MELIKRTLSQVLVELFVAAMVSGWVASRGVWDCSAFVAELWGVLEGLRCARRLGFMYVEMEIDSAAVVKALKDRCVKSPMGAALAKQVWQLLDMEWNIEILHIYREANKCADAMANLGCSLGYDVILYADCPLPLREMLAFDNMGISTPRFISVMFVGWVRRIGLMVVKKIIGNGKGTQFWIDKLIEDLPHFVKFD
ncbi:hypothetical protein TSUD_233050 [Trifolium subterraneum]|uniref:RNase H type-1 domain-containing protein n=1 Tax=Trifolium subterraneum TaxID=3900 RepID=A0A2Z6MH49_TRISU|nr:hypothetical protein TSUD_233050 [Trifolium subterraneum]